ncbi:MAG: hypothetical protein JWN52_4229 [Actinomycetia bacterium]|jgi:hypothetical protein|nr:hypothetical protein [Actinomycetes bacterium]
MNVQQRPAWAGKPIVRLTADEITEALAFLTAREDADDILSRALAKQLADQTAAGS